MMRALDSSKQSIRIVYLMEDEDSHNAVLFNQDCWVNVSKAAVRGRLCCGISACWFVWTAVKGYSGCEYGSHQL